MGADGGAKIDIDTSGGGRTGPLIHLVCQGGACLGDRSCSRAGEEEKSGICRTPKRINSVCSCFQEK